MTGTGEPSASGSASGPAPEPAVGPSPGESPAPGASPTPAPQPLDVDGVLAVGVGTALWAVAFVVLLVLRSSLRAHGHLWWLGTCAAGVGLGLAGLVYVTRRRRAIRLARG